MNELFIDLCLFFTGVLGGHSPPLVDFNKIYAYFIHLEGSATPLFPRVIGKFAQNRFILVPYYKVSDYILSTYFQKRLFLPFLGSMY